jgi:protein-S-isoprenylcysteine O-methyltransferase Ste14
MSRLPALGSRGEGWVVAQGVLLVLTAAAGSLGPAWDGAARVACAVLGAALIGAGAVLAIRGTLDLGNALTPFPHPRADATLVQTGVYRWVRHPIYGGIVLASLGWALVTASIPALVMAAVVWGFFTVKSMREEAWLVDRFPDYPAYRTRTRRLIPWPGAPRG